MQVTVLLVFIIKLLRILQPDPEDTDHEPENLLAVALPTDAHQMVSWTPSQGLRMHQQTNVRNAFRRLHPKQGSRGRLAWTN